MSQVFVVGEALMDIVTTPTRKTHHPGGSPANVALGLSRLGVRTTFLTALARDEDGQKIDQHLSESGVEIAAESFTARRTSTAIATIAVDGTATYEFNIDWEIPEVVPPPSAKITHTGSIASFLQPGAEQVQALIERARASSIISFDPNIRPSLIGDHQIARAQFETLVALAHIVKLSDEDAEWLYPKTDIATVTQILLDLGAITKGAQGSVLSTAAQSVALDAVSEVGADTIGAGDSYTAALLAAILTHPVLSMGQNQLAALDTDDLRYLGSRAATAAAITVGRAGANLPFLAELEHRLTARTTPR